MDLNRDHLSLVEEIEDYALEDMAKTFARIEIQSQTPKSATSKELFKLNIGPEC
jgi:hypothetical protein